LARLALGAGEIDAAGYTVIRLLSGTVALLAIFASTKPRNPPNIDAPANSKGSWLAAAMLFAYAVTFSYAYITLDTGTGALILFGAVQITMILVSVMTGIRPKPAEWFGLVLAFGGFVYLILPGLSTPSALGFALMTISGIAWGLYTLQGQKSKDPLADTAFNFVRTTPLVLIVLLFTIGQVHFTLTGVLLAVLSGAITSGVGYTLWYAALTSLSTTRAAVLQLLVPVLAAIGGVVFVAEPLTLRLIVSTMFILSGILLVVLARRASQT